MIAATPATCGPAVYCGDIGASSSERHKWQPVRARGAQDRSVRTRESCRAGLRMQRVVERSPNGDDTTARPCLGFENDDRDAGFVEKISCAQAGETGADDHDRLIDRLRTRRNASNDSCGERYPTRHLLKKSSAIHVLFLRLGDGSSASARVAIRKNQNTAPPIMTRGSMMSMTLTSSSYPGMPSPRRAGAANNTPEACDRQRRGTRSVKAK